MAREADNAETTGEFVVTHVTPHPYTYFDLRPCRLISLTRLHDPFQEYIFRKRLEALALAREEKEIS